MRFILASKSPARLQTLKRAGIEPEVLVSGVDESGAVSRTPSDLVQELATLKGEAVIARLPADTEAVVVACDSLLEFGGRVIGKPYDTDTARMRWYQMRGGTGMLHTGHHVTLLTHRTKRTMTRVVSTLVRFADLADAEIEAYLGTGEPQRVAGGFTIDGFGGPYIAGIQGDPHNVVGISLPALRQMLADLGLPWHSLWRDKGGTR